MNVEALMQLISSNSTENAEIAWQVAWGQKQGGDPEFQDFVKAVAAWAFSDMPSRRPVEFIKALHQQELHCNVLRKMQLPISSKALAPFVRRIFVNDIQTEAFPKGFEYFDEADYLYFSTQRFKTLGAELQGMIALRALKFDSRFYFEFLPEFIETPLHKLSVSTYNKVRLPENLPQMQQLEALHLLCGVRFEGPVWDCTQLKRLVLSDMTYEFSWEALFPVWEHVTKLQNLESLALYLPHQAETGMLPSYFFELENLKHLKIVPASFDSANIAERIEQLSNLETLTIGWLDSQELKSVLLLPNLKKLITCNRNQYNDLCARVKSHRPDITVELYKRELL